jgi:hypothetical protein
MKWVTKIEERIGFTTSILGAMRYIKISGLGPKVGPLLEQTRVHEVQAAGQFRLLSVVSSTVANIPLLISPVITFAVYTMIAVRHGTTLDATRLFTTLSLLILLSEPLFNVFGGLIDFMSAIGCLRRIEAFLTKPSRVDKRQISQAHEDKTSHTPSEKTISRKQNDGTHQETHREIAHATDIEAPCLTIEGGYFGWA